MKHSNFDKQRNFEDIEEILDESDSDESVTVDEVVMDTETDKVTIELRM